MIERRTFLTGATALLLAIPTARAQQKIPRIAYVSRGVPGGFAIEAVLQGLRDHGYVEDENITIEYYWFREFNELPLLLPRVVASRPDVIVAIQTPTALATKGATEDIPIVIAAIAIADAVAVGIVPSLARPGANVTGVHLNMAGTAGQRLQLLMELVPGLARIAVMHVSNNAAQLAILAQAQRDGQVLGLDIRPVGVTTVDDMDNVLKGLAADGVQAVLIAGIDAPEKKQAFGNRSKQNMVRLAHDRQARADCPKRNHYGRYVCKVWVGGDVGLTIPAQLRPL